MKKLLLTISTLALFGGSMLAQTLNFFPTNNATTGVRGPNPGNRAQINCSIYPSTDFGGAIPNGASIVFVGWYLQGGSGTVTPVGNMQVYLENTTNTIYAKTSNTWTAITAPMTSVYNSTIAIPNSTTVAAYGVNITPFTFTGNGLYVGFAYTNAGTLGSTGSHTYIAYSAPGTTVTTPMTKTNQSAVSATLPTTVVATPSVFKACIVIGYQMTGQEPGITYVTVDGTNQKVNTGVVPVTIGLRNIGTVNVPAASYNIVATNGVTTQTITTTPAINSSTSSVVTATLGTPTIAGLNNYTFTLNSSADVYAADNIGIGSRFFFPTKAIFMEDFNDTAKWKNIVVGGVSTTTLNAAALPAGFSLINNDLGGTVGPFFIGSVIADFEGNQSLSDNFASANGFKIDDWLITPQITGFCTSNKDSLEFYLKGTGAYADSVEVLLSPTGGNAITDFSVSVAYVLAPGATWTKFSYGLNSLLPVGTGNYRVAFRYKMGNGGQNGANSDNFAIDCAHITRTNAVISSNAGTDQIVATTLANLSGVVTGAGTTSTWVQNSGPSSTITSSTSASSGVVLTTTGIYCYSLTVTDGCNTTSDEICINASIPTGITTADIELISINPNPAKDMVYLNTSSIIGTDIAISIVSVDGRVVYSTNTVAGDKMAISIQNLNAGVYFINVSGKEFKQMTKLIKE